MTSTFTRMDESTAEQWAVIGAETTQNQGRVADRILDMLRSLEAVTDGFAVDQLVHSCQTATRAERAGAEPEVVFAALCHDIGKAVSVPNHPRIAAEILRPYVSDDVYQMVLTHQDFQGRHYYHHFGGNPDAANHVRGPVPLRADRHVRRRVGPDRVRPRLRHPAAGALRAAGPRDDRPGQHALTNPGSLSDRSGGHVSPDPATNGARICCQRR